MRWCDVQPGGVYIAKVSGRLTSVRIDRIYETWLYARPRTHASATNIATGRAVRIRSPQRLRGPAATGAGGGRS